MLRLAVCFLASWSILMLDDSVTRADLTAEPSERGVVVKVDGQPFTEYLKRAGHQPALWPIIGPTGHPMTRSYPVGPRVEGETNDHPHHVSLWFVHGAVNGLDFWTATSTNRDPDRGNRIVHRDFATVESGTQAKIVSRNDWLADEKKICEDERTIIFGQQENGDRWIDFAVKLTASEEELTLGDTKEGTFGVRVADSIRVEAKQGGKIVNSRGEENAAAWGKLAEWVDNSGPVAGETVGIAILTHPSSFRPVCRWHARGYGLLAANPFGEREFLAETRRQRAADEPQQGVYVVPRGQSLSFRYRVLLHRGDAQQAGVADVFKEYAATAAAPPAAK
jgi:hypothetical protein